ncbi:MAG: UDP-2,4-diacetamido-2,4,6-trideoxy-beta-L-altropyranose hydrolase [Agathobacter sp.]|nr:UDP-2,4-diacetamido-2,4,6-trideoxy-beta-L-altropyranose hydrolase [Agathobacter sp.]
MAKIIIRADGNSVIGAGHIMRCISIAKEMHRRGNKCTFIISDTSFEQIIRDNGLNAVVLDSDYRDLDNEIEKLKPLMREIQPDFIIVDSYYVTKRYFEEIRAYAPVVYIDDRLEFEYPVWMIINYNIYSNRDQYEILYANKQLPRLVLGTKYVPLREEFQNIKNTPKSDGMKRVLISTGGADRERILLGLANKLLEKKYENIQFHLLVGAFEPDKEELRQIAKNNGHIIIYENVKKVSELMLQCDLAISAAGSTLYELCACGIPTITYVIADNQIMGAEAMAEKGIMIYAGDYRSKVAFYENIVSQMKTLLVSKNKLKTMAKNSQRLVDGKGVGRIVDEIITE